VRLEFRRWPENLLPLFWSTVPETQVEAEIQKYQASMAEREERDKEIARRLYGAIRPEKFDPLSSYEMYRVSLETPKGTRWVLVEAGSSEAAHIVVQAAYPELAVTEIAANWEAGDPALHINS